MFQAFGVSMEYIVTHFLFLPEEVHLDPRGGGSSGSAAFVW